MSLSQCPSVLIELIANYCDHHCLLTSPTLVNLLIAGAHTEDVSEIIITSIVNRWRFLPDSIRIHQKIKLPPAQVSQILVRKPCRTSCLKICLHFDQLHPMTRLLARLDILAREAMKRQYPRSWKPNIKQKIGTRNLNLVMPRYGLGDLNTNLGIGFHSYSWTNVTTITDTSICLNPKVLQINDCIEMIAVVSGRAHNKHQYHALCLRGVEWNLINSNI